MPTDKDERTIVLLTTREVDRAVTVLRGITLDVKPPWEIALRKHKTKRSLEQNKRYHAVCSEIAEQLILHGRHYHPDTLKEYFKSLFIGTTEAVYPDGTIVRQPISTTTLSVGEFAEYMTKIDAWATEHGVIFEETRALLDQYAAQAREWRERYPNG